MSPTKTLIQVAYDSEIDSNDENMFGLNHTSDGGWIHSVKEVLGLDSFNSMRSQVKIIRIDSIGNIIWSKVMTSTTLSYNQIWDIKPTPDGNWIGVGDFVSENIEAYGGWLFKFDDDGNILWSRVDTVHIEGGNPKNPITNFQLRITRCRCNS